MTRPYSPRADQRWVERVVTDIVKRGPSNPDHIKRLRSDLATAASPALRDLIVRRLAELEA